MADKIGVGIISHNREDYFKQVLASIPEEIDVYVANTGTPYKEDIYNNRVKELYQFTEKTCVGWGKNKVMQMMIDSECDHIFTMEDDVIVTDPNVFVNYINTAYKTGIYHFNFGFSQKENFDLRTGKRLIKETVDYGNGATIVLTPNILGAFTYYHRGVLEHIGLHDEDYNACHMDHPDLTYRAIKAGLHPPFWWFADINKSWEMLGNLSNMADDSIVRNDSKFKEDIGRAFELFKSKHGYTPVQVPPTSRARVHEVLKSIKANYSRDKNV